MLETIIEQKKKEVAERKKNLFVTDLERSEFYSREIFSLKKALLKENSSGIIAEFKRKSPSKGTINNNADVLEVTTSYRENGAAGLSILTDEEFFGGSSDDLQQARVNSIPILRKDFIIDEYQVIETKTMGADVMLLIAACLSAGEVKSLATVAKNLGLEVLLELHDESELGHICEQVDLVGINNRDLKTFSVDIERSLRMAEKIPAGILKIAESGISTVEDILMFRQNGFRGFLIGEVFMKESDPGLALSEFVTALQLAPPHAEGF